ncbi:MAG: beta,4-xylanase, family [Chloroflexota bacterium]|jgi:hypothetical protein|nr:beta,4-xylanase, family [Chloroflexota bacterium]
MRSLISSRVLRVHVAALVAMALIVGSAAAVAAKPPPKPPPTPSPTPTVAPPPAAPTITIASTGSLEPDQVYANIDVTVTCAVGSTFTNGWIYILQNDRGGSGSFTTTCTGTPQVARSRVVNGNRFTLGNWTARAFVRVTKNGQQTQVEASRTITLVPGVSVRIADQGQLTGTSGGAAKLAVAVACPSGATGQSSSVTLTQGAAIGSASFTPICDRQTTTVVLSFTASGGTFHTGSATAAASASVGFNGESFSGTDSREVTILESSTGDTTPPSTPPNLGANVFGDGETWLDWNASTDNATPSGLIVYEVFLNGRFDQPIGGGLTAAILYADLGVVNTIDVFAVDGAGNRSAPATVTVDCSFGFGCQ